MSDLTTGGDARMPVRSVAFFAASLGLGYGALIWVSSIFGGHVWGPTRLALSVAMGVLLSGWAVLLFRLKNRRSAGRLVNVSVVLFPAVSTIVVPAVLAVLTGGQFPRLSSVLLGLMWTLFMAAGLAMASGLGGGRGTAVGDPRGRGRTTPG